MTGSKVIINVYCTEPDDRVIETRCAVCKRCYLYVACRKRGQCAFGGPFGGFKAGEKS